MSFLEKYELNSIPLNLQIADLKPTSLFLGEGAQPLEIAIFSSFKKPTTAKAQEAFRKRRARRAAAVLIVITHQEGITLCGTSGEQPPVYFFTDQDQVERLCRKALEKRDKNESIKFLSESLPSLEGNLPGIINEGLLSNHELEDGVTKRGDWEEASEKSEKIIKNSESSLLLALGFTPEKSDNLSEILRREGEDIAISISLNQGELPQISNNRFNNISPISYGLTKAEKLNIPWVLLLYRNGIRLYSTKNLGIARRSRSETFIECQPYLLSSKNIGLLWILFTYEALKKGGYIEEILYNSKRFAIDIAEKLKERIYEKVVPLLAMGISKERNILEPSREDLIQTYEMAVTVLFRLLFISYAEDRDFLPYKNNENYRKISLKQKAIELSLSSENSDNIQSHYWDEIALLCEAISMGNKEYSIPAYGGTIFSKDISISKVGFLLSKITISDQTFKEVLKNLLLTKTNEGVYAPIDFRSLSVREFGTIYEGILESELSVAQENLSVNSKGVYEPTRLNNNIKIRKGNIYLHDRSGARKLSGSFFTPEFLVEHILDQSLEPALDEHLKNLTKLDDANRVENFFDFRVADIAMGSGHFLVAAIDRIELKFARWLEENPTSGISRELNFLKGSAKKALGELAETIEIDDNQILRRMIARRCIYGSDLNPITVQLSQLSIWIHTFVPGLPLSLLDHNLIHGNALIGVDSLEQIRSKLNLEKGTLFELKTEEILSKAAEPLKKLALLSDGSMKDIEEARSLMIEAKNNIEDIKSICDIIISQPLSNNPRLSGYIFEKFSLQNSEKQTSEALKLANHILKKVYPIHFPIAFPEVFLSKKNGFNVILGNPPWKEAIVNEDKFWTRYSPGLSGMKTGEQEKVKELLREKRPDLVFELNQELTQTKLIRDFLHAGNFPGMNTGDPDLYKAFLWRFWFLTSKNRGRIGIVFPRTGLSSKGSEKFRRKLFESADSINITTLVNAKNWVFDMEARYTIAVASILKSLQPSNKTITIKGPYSSYESFDSEREIESQKIKTTELLNWNESVSLPVLPSTYSLEVFTQLRKSPWFSLNKKDQWRVRPDREMDQTNQKFLMDFSENHPKDFWKVYKGASFEIWNPDTGSYNAFADPSKVLTWIQEKRLRSHKKKDSVHSEYPKEYLIDKKTLSPLSARIVVRDVTNRTNTRTVIACLIPPQTFITNKGPVLMFPRGDKKDESYLLGVLCSIPLDWYARRFVETNLNFFILNSFPIPRPSRDNPLWMKVVKLSGRLACSDERFKDWAYEVGVDYGPLEPEIKLEMMCKIDAIVSKLYGLSEKHLIHIFETFHEGWNYESRLNKVLNFFHEY